MGKSFYFIVLFLWCAAAFGETRVYRETTGDNVLIHEYTIDPAASGHSVVITSLKGGHLVSRTEMDVDSEFSTLRWTYAERQKGIDLSAYRKGDVIFLSGHLKGKRVSKKLKISSFPWFQAYPLSLEKFSVSKKNKRLYWSINPSDTKVYDFLVTKKEFETLTVNGRQEEVVHLYISLTGIRFVFWHADSWHRRSDGMYLCYEGVNGMPGTPLTVKELIRTE
jgi:hypothetical protein